MANKTAMAVVVAAFLAHAAGASTVRFAVIGDDGQSPNTAAVAAGVLGSNPDFLCTVGDNTYSTTLSSANWDVRGSSASYTGYFSLPGNERYDSFTQGNVQFFMLSSDPREPDGVTVGSTQYNWFTSQIAQSTARWQVVMFHHPFQTSNSTHGPSTSMNWGFENMGVDMVMSGHNHFMERLSYGGIPWIVQGAGGRSHYSISSPAANSMFRNTTDDGFSMVTATDSTLTHQFVRADGTVLKTFTVPAPGALALLAIGGMLRRRARG